MFVSLYMRDRGELTELGHIKGGKEIIEIFISV